MRKIASDNAGWIAKPTYTVKTGVKGSPFPYFTSTGKLLLDKVERQCVLVSLLHQDEILSSAFAAHFCSVDR